MKRLKAARPPTALPTIKGVSARCEPCDTEEGRVLVVGGKLVVGVELAVAVELRMTQSRDPLNYWQVSLISFYRAKLYRPSPRTEIGAVLVSPGIIPLVMLKELILTVKSKP